MYVWDQWGRPPYYFEVLIIRIFIGRNILHSHDVDFPNQNVGRYLDSDRPQYFISVLQGKIRQLHKQRRVWFNAWTFFANDFVILLRTWSWYISTYLNWNLITTLTLVLLTNDVTFKERRRGSQETDNLSPYEIYPATNENLLQAIWKCTAHLKSTQNVTY